MRPGDVLLHYRIVERIGEGGMGVVWRATDTTLGRDVAVKVLPESVANDDDRLARFEREAKLLASLNHPNIAAIYGLHDAGGIRLLAMELVDGEDLSDRLARGAVPLVEALDIGRQVAEALEAAHDCGIVHRDLKPANIKQTPDGKVKVLDFGLAKALDAGTARSGNDDPSRSPTLTSAGTVAGTLLGTAGYMSPEQARGRPVDRRADIWSFGVVLFELLSGVRLFDGETASDSVAAVLTREPDWSRLPVGTPSAVRELLRRCLERDPRRRLRDIGEARIVLEAPGVTTEIESHPVRMPSRGPWVALAIAGTLLGAALAWGLKPETESPLRRLALASPIGTDSPRQWPRISPDGRSMVYVADARLWIQDLDQLTARPVTGGDGASVAVWSPDGRSLAFSVGNRLFRAAVGGDPIVVSELPGSIGDSGGGLCWTAHSTLVFATGDDSLYEVPVAGGTPKSILDPQLPHETDFHEPFALPEGRGILYLVHRSPQGLDTLEVFTNGERKTIFREEGAWLGHPAYSPTGHILFERNDTSVGIWAIPFSLTKLETTGDPILITSEGSHASVSDDRTLVYSNATSGGSHQLVVSDREGRVLDTIGERMQHVDNATLSPQQDRIATCVTEAKDDNLWIHDLRRRSRSRLVRNAHCASRRGGLSWSADGKFIVFGDTDSMSLRRRQTDGSTEESRLTEGLQPALSADGTFIVFTREAIETRSDIWRMRLDGSPPEPLIATPAREDLPHLSPDGSLLAYVSDETGRSEVYVRSLLQGGASWQVSGEGGEFPRWSRDGHRLFFTKNEDVLVEAEIRRTPALEIGENRQLFAASRSRLGLLHGYDVLGDGDRIVTVEYERPSKTGADLTMVTNWPGP